MKTDFEEKSWLAHVSLDPTVCVSNFVYGSGLSMGSPSSLAEVIVLHLQELLCICRTWAAIMLKQVHHFCYVTTLLRCYYDEYNYQLSVFVGKWTIMMFNPSQRDGKGLHRLTIVLRILFRLRALKGPHNMVLCLDQQNFASRSSLLSSKPPKAYS